MNLHLQVTTPDGREAHEGAELRSRGVRIRPQLISHPVCLRANPLLVEATLTLEDVPVARATGCSEDDATSNVEKAFVARLAELLRLPGE